MTETEMFISIMCVLGPVIIVVSFLMYALDYCIAERKEDEEE